MIRPSVEHTESVELGKSLIVKYVRHVMVSHGGQPDSIAFRWQQERGRWVLHFLMPREQVLISFTDRDIISWPRYHAIVEGIYRNAVHDAIHRLKGYHP